MDTKIYKTVTVKKQKRIALVAHDNMKKKLISWVKDNKEVLSQHFLCGTGTTSILISKETNLPVKSFKSGPLGGDLQIGAQICNGDIDLLIFFWDPLTAQPHDPDVKALLRVSILYNIPVANNQSTADFLLYSEFMNKDYRKVCIDYEKTIESRVNDMTK
ncbi:MAG: methylglyoxal synthase [Oscillospiraceae bacterium]